MSSKKTIILLFIINIFFIFFSYKTFFCFSKNIIKIHQKLTLILTYDNEKIDIINKINKTAKQLNILKKIKDNNNNTKNNNIKKNIKTKNVKKNKINKKTSNYSILETIKEYLKNLILIFLGIILFLIISSTLNEIFFSKYIEKYYQKYYQNQNSQTTTENPEKENKNIINTIKKKIIFFLYNFKITCILEKISKKTKEKISSMNLGESFQNIRTSIASLENSIEDLSNTIKGFYSSKDAQQNNN